MNITVDVKEIIAPLKAGIGPIVGGTSMCG
jgi:hypothetical protein